MPIFSISKIYQKTKKGKRNDRRTFDFLGILAINKIALNFANLTISYFTDQHL